MEPFKNIFNEQTVKKISKEIKQVYKPFKKADFDKECLKTLETLELKDRVRLISSKLEKYLTEDYKNNITILLAILADESEHEQNEWDGKNSKGISGFITWPLAHYIEEHGLDDLESSMQGMYEITKRFTAEFAIRPFLEKYEKLIYKKYLNKWVKDKSRHVRRLVSEGTRPNLPWGSQVTWIKKNPAQNLYLLELLKDDPEEYVRRSVANHLNDISRIDKKLMLNTLSKWDLKNKNTAWIVRHATRSLLKAGDPKALKLNGYDIKPKVKVSKFKLCPKKFKEGESFAFKFDLTNESSKPLNLLIDYIIHYPKKNGFLSPKAFRLKAVRLKKGETITIEKTVTFKKVTTRKHYPGAHIFELKICDQIFLKSKFTLLDT
jgi:3-methyladenine DNA glycosylase AlkC